MKLFFDLLIITGLTATVLPAIIFLYHRTKSANSWEYKHRENSLAIALALFLVAIIILYGSFLEPRQLFVKKQIIDLPKIEQPIKIAFFADSQLGPYKQSEHVQKIVEMVLALKPDLVLIGGDMIDNSGFEIEKEIDYWNPLRQLTDKVPVYVVSGNHEYSVNFRKQKEGPLYYYPDASKKMKEKILSLGGYFLENNLEKITINGQSFYLFGGDEWWAGKLDFSTLDKERTEDLATIALIHNPAAAFEASKHNIDLMLSGHTHGGQIRLPFIGPLGIVDDVIPHNWYLGLNRVDNMQLFITGGTGETGVRARLFNPPEIVLLTIK